MAPSQAPSRLRLGDVVSVQIACFGEEYARSKARSGPVTLRVRHRSMMPQPLTLGGMITLGPQSMHVGTVGREPTTAASLARMRAVEGSTCAAGPRVGIAWTGMPKGSRQNIRAATVSRELSGPG